MSADKRITLAWTGASGAPYGLRLLQQLLAADYQVFLLMSSAAKVVLATETDLQLPGGKEAGAFLARHFQVDPEQLRLCGREEWLSPVASGSAAPKQMVICPCSTGTLASIAMGLSDNLIERAADVVIKERGQLILVPRETPLSAIHLEAMLKLARLGVTLLPAAPGFYHHPTSIEQLVDFIVGRILDQLGIAQNLVSRWGYGHKE